MGLFSQIMRGSCARTVTRLVLLASICRANLPISFTDWEWFGEPAFNLWTINNNASSATQASDGGTSMLVRTSGFSSQIHVCITKCDCVPGRACAQLVIRSNQKINVSFCSVNSTQCSWRGVWGRDSSGGHWEWSFVRHKHLRDYFRSHALMCGWMFDFASVSVSSSLPYRFTIPLGTLFAQVSASFVVLLNFTLDA